MSSCGQFIASAVVSWRWMAFHASWVIGTKPRTCREVAQLQSHLSAMSVQTCGRRTNYFLLSDVLVHKISYGQLSLNLSKTNIPSHPHLLLLWCSQHWLEICSYQNHKPSPQKIRFQIWWIQVILSLKYSSKVFLCDHPHCLVTSHLAYCSSLAQVSPHPSSSCSITSVR